MDPVSIASLCFTVLKNAGVIIFEFKSLKDKIGGAVESLEQLVKYVASLEVAIRELAELANRGKLSATEDTTDTIKDSLQVCDGQLLLIAKYISKIKPRPRRAGLGFRGTFWSLWNEDAIKASKDVLKEHISSLTLVLQIISLKSTPQQDQEIRKASQTGKIVVKASRSEASQRLRNFLASLEAHSEETVQTATERARLAAKAEKANSKIDNAIRKRRDSRLEADRARQKERHAIEARHRQTIEERRQARFLGLPEELPASRQWERLFQVQESDVSNEASTVTATAAQSSSWPRSNITSPPPHATPSPLMVACAGDDIAQAAALIQAGHDVNEGRGNMTALHIAAATANSELARLLLSCGAHVEAREAFGQTPLHVAAFSNAHEVVSLLVQDGADLECVKTGEQQPSPHALRSPNGDEIPVGWRPLHCAADQGHGPIAAILISGGAAVMARTYDGSTALHLASAKSRFEMVLFLLANGADPDARTYGDITALKLARSSGSAEIVQCLTAAGTDLH